MRAEPWHATPAPEEALRRLAAGGAPWERLVEAALARGAFPAPVLRALVPGAEAAWRRHCAGWAQRTAQPEEERDLEPGRLVTQSALARTGTCDVSRYRNLVNSGW